MAIAASDCSANAYANGAGVTLYEAGTNVNEIKKGSELNGSGLEVLNNRINY
jgi:hypothetical protein